MARCPQRANKRNSNKSKTHCPQGHAYTPDNTYLQRRKSPRTGKPYLTRICRACHLWAGKLYDTYVRDHVKTPKRGRNPTYVDRRRRHGERPPYVPTLLYTRDRGL